MYTRPFLLFLFAFSIKQTAFSQLLADTMFTWQGYLKPGICSIQLFMNPDEQSKTYTIILTELAENTGQPTTAEIGYLAEHIGRTYNIDPTQAYWVIHWGAFSYQEATKSNKELFIRATFHRTSTQRIGAPQWKIIEREDVEKYTDRQFLKWKER